MEKKWWTLLAVCIGTFMLLLDVTIVVVAIPGIQTGLKASFGQVQWVVDAYALTLAALLLTAGVLADRYGRRLLFSIGLTIFTLGSLLCGVAQDPIMLVVSRSAQGVGGAIMFATSLALLGQSFQGKDRGVAFGIWGAITGVAVSLGPILGGVITTGISWRAIFLVNVPIGVVAVSITWWRVEESRAPNPGRPDWTGFVLLTAGLISLVYGLIWAGESSWTNVGVVICLVAGGLLLVGFAIAEARVKDPMFDLALFRVPTFDGGLVAAFCMNGSLFAMLLYLVLYLQYALGYSALQTGLRLLLISGPTLVTATLAGRLSEHMPVRWLIGPGLLLVGVGLLLMAGVSGTSSWTHLAPGFVLAGAGAGLVNPPLASTAIGVVQPHRAGMASGVNTTFRQVGIAVSIAALGTIFTASLNHNLGRLLAGVPQLHTHAQHIISQVSQGDVTDAFNSVPNALRGQLQAAITSSFASGINELLYVAGAVALVGAVGSMLLIRNRDFAHRQAAAVAETGARQPVPDSV